MAAKFDTEVKILLLEIQLTYCCNRQNIEIFEVGKISEVRLDFCWYNQNQENICLYQKVKSL